MGFLCVNFSRLHSCHRPPWACDLHRIGWVGKDLKDHVPCSMHPQITAHLCQTQTIPPNLLPKEVSNTPCSFSQQRSPPWLTLPGRHNALSILTVHRKQAPVPHTKKNLPSGHSCLQVVQVSSVPQFLFCATTKPSKHEKACLLTGRCTIGPC